MKTAAKKGAGIKPKNGDSIDTIMDKVAAVSEYIKLGMTMTDSARAVGVNPRTLYSWLDKSKAGQAGYEPIEAIFEQNRAIGQAKLIGIVTKAADDDWKAAAWILERRHPDFRRQQDIILNNGQPLELDINAFQWTKNSEERLAELLAKRQEIEALKSKEIDGIL